MESTSSKSTSTGAPVQYLRTGKLPPTYRLMAQEIIVEKMNRDIPTATPVQYLRTETLPPPVRLKTPETEVEKINRDIPTASPVQYLRTETLPQKYYLMAQEIKVKKMIRDIPTATPVLRTETLPAPVRLKTPETEVEKINRDIHIKNMKDLKNTIKHLKNDKRKEGSNYTEEYSDTVVEISKAYFKTDNKLKTERLQISREIASSGAAFILCDLVVDIHTVGYIDTDYNLIVLKSALSALTNFSDSDQESIPIICEHPKFLETSAKYLKEFENSKDDSYIISLVDQFLSVIHNVAMYENNVSKVRGHDFVKVITPYLESPFNNLRLIAIAAMADIVNEEESELLQKGQNVLEFLKKVLQASMKAENRMHPWLGWPVWELIRIMRIIARNDTNKKALVNMGFLPLLVELGRSKDQREKREAIGTLRTLSFDEEIQAKMISDTSSAIPAIFIAERFSADEQISKSSKGALWTMREQLAQNDKYKDIDIVKQFAAHKAKEQERAEAQKSRGHVMISYQWSDQPMLLKVCQYLRKNNFKVWMDVDDMAGSIIEAMARAVEEAEVILVCYSRKYKDSDTCRAEAEYAFQKRKTIVPLRMEQGYKADGWLGIILGAKKFYDFSGKYTFDSRTKDLVKELRLKFGSDHEQIVPQQAMKVYSQPMKYSPAVEAYSSAGVDVKFMIICPSWSVA